MAVKFPSVEFFQELAERMNADRPTFEKLGFCDVVMGVRVEAPTPRLFSLTFEVFECSDVREVESPADAELDFTLDAPLSLWREMLESFRSIGWAEPQFTLNSLSHLGDRMMVVFDDPEGHDKLYRFIATLQEFFDNANELEVE